MILRNNSAWLVGTALLSACVFEADQLPPIVVAGSDRSVNENQLLNFAVTVSDPGREAVALTALNLPSGSDFSGGIFSWTPSYSQAGSYALRFQAQSNSLSDTDTVIVIVNNVDRPPSVNAGLDRGAYENKLLSFAVTAADPDSNLVALSLISPPAGAVIAGSNFTWTPSYSQAGIYSLRFRAQSYSLCDTDTVVITVKNMVRPGFYYGGYGPAYDSTGFASELTLDSNGNHRWFKVEYNYATLDFQGKWTATDSELTLSQQLSSYLDYNFFGQQILEQFLNFQPDSSDTIPIRRITDTSFERFEIAPDGRRAIWVPYRLTHQTRPAAAKYVYRDTTDGWDSVGNPIPVVYSHEYRFADSGAVYHYYENVLPFVEIAMPNWLQVGSFLVADHPRRRFYVDSLQDFGPWADTLGGDWVRRLRDVTDTSFQMWDPFSYPGRWMDFRKEP